MTPGSKTEMFNTMPLLLCCCRAKTQSESFTIRPTLNCCSTDYWHRIYGLGRYDDNNDAWAPPLSREILIWPWKQRWQMCNAIKERSFEISCRRCCIGAHPTTVPHLSPTFTHPPPHISCCPWTLPLPRLFLSSGWWWWDWYPMVRFLI